MNEATMLVVVLVGCFLALGAIPIVAFVLMWRTPAPSPVTPTQYVLDAPIVEQLSKRISDLERQQYDAQDAHERRIEELQQRANEQMLAERAECDRRVDMLMREIARLTLKLEELEPRASQEQGDYHLGSRLFGLMADSLGADEIQILAFDLGYDYENLRGETAHMKAMQMILKAGREDRLPEMVRRLKNNRPDVDWPSVKKVKAL